MLCSGGATSGFVSCCPRPGKSDEDVPIDRPIRVWCEAVHTALLRREARGRRACKSQGLQDRHSTCTHCPANVWHLCSADGSFGSSHACRCRRRGISRRDARWVSRSRVALFWIRSRAQQRDGWGCRGGEDASCAERLAAGRSFAGRTCVRVLGERARTFAEIAVDCL